MTDEPAVRDESELARFRLAVDELLDLALQVRWKVAQEPDLAGGTEPRELVAEIEERVAWWREQLLLRPALWATADERLRHAQNIAAECAAILAGRPPREQP